jgi:hypothetical protein
MDSERMPTPHRLSTADCLASRMARILASSGVMFEIGHSPRKIFNGADGCGKRLQVNMKKMKNDILLGITGPPSD